MTNHRSDSQSKSNEVAQVVRLVDAKSARKEATPPTEGIRPTREGPWDPCRFQEYEVSPEFRLQLMTAKPPPADPSLFVATLPPTSVAELVPCNARIASGSIRRATKIKLLVLSGALVGLLIGFVVARNRGHQSELTEGTVLLQAPSAALITSTPAPSNTVNADSQRITTLGSAESPKQAIESKTAVAKLPWTVSPTLRSGTVSKKSTSRTTSSTDEDSDPAWVEPK